MIDRKTLPVVVIFGLAFLILAVLWLLRPTNRPLSPEPTTTQAVIPFTGRTETPGSTAPKAPTEMPDVGSPKATATLIQPPAQPTMSPTATEKPSEAKVEGFFVAPEPLGRPGGNGSYEQPWDIETAFKPPKPVKPGDTIWLRGGTYGTGGDTRFVSKLQGEEGKPIIVRQYPGERAIIDGGILAQGAWTWFWGFEITNTSADRLANGKERPPGLYMEGRGHKAINLVVYNTGHPGIGFWSDVGDGGEVYGCIIWGVGTYDTDRDSRTRGSAIYAQNADGTHVIRDVISFRNLTTGMKAYGEKEAVNGFTFEGNISFENADRLIFISGRDFPVQGLVMRNNYTYRSPTEEDPPVRLGYFDIDQGDAVIEGNVFVNGIHEDGAFWVKRFRNLQFTNNTLVSPNVLTTLIQAADGANGKIVWDNNQYYGGSFAPFRLNALFFPFDLWKELSTFDQNSTYQRNRPTGEMVFVRPNQYEPERANIVVYNWDQKSTVVVDLSSALKPGDSYQIVDVQNYFGDPVVKGVYDGNPVEIPMALFEVSAITAQQSVKNVHTSLEFGAFVLMNSPK